MGSKPDGRIADLEREVAEASDEVAAAADHLNWWDPDAFGAVPYSELDAAWRAAHDRWIAARQKLERAKRAVARRQVRTSDAGPIAEQLKALMRQRNDAEARITELLPNLRRAEDDWVTLANIIAEGGRPVEPIKRAAAERLDRLEAEYWALVDQVDAAERRLAALRRRVKQTIRGIARLVYGFIGRVTKPKSIGGIPAGVRREIAASLWRPAPPLTKK